MRAAVFFIALLCAQPALAQARIEVAPVRVELSSQKSIGSLRVRNTSTEPVAFEVAAVSWTQRDGEDQLTPTTKILVSPPAFVIPPGGEQIVRVGAHITLSASEEAFRLLFSEQALLDARADDSALRMRLELSLPVFVTPPAPRQSIGPLVEWQGEGAERKLRISNPTDRHVVLAGAQIGDAKVTLPRYLLAGASVERPAPSDSAPLTLAFLQADEIVKRIIAVRPILTAVRATVKAGALWALCAGVAEAREQTILNFQVEGGANATAFAWRDGAEILVEPQLITMLGLRAAAVGSDMVSLRAVRGLSYVVNEATASVNIICTADCFAAHVLEEGAEIEAAAPALTGLILNYDLSASAIDGSWRGGGLFDGVILGKTARIEASALTDSEEGFRRLETTWVRDRTHGRTRLRIGDSISRGGGWALPVRYGGVKFGTDFSLDPAFVSFPTPQMAGAASLPSTLDIYVNDTLRQRREAPAGPFTVADPPLAAGANTATLVITDALGRQQVVTQAFYVAPTLLRDGLFDYTADLGVQRRNYIEKSNDYAEPLAALTMRRGFKRFTGELRGEAQSGAQALGTGIAGASALLGEGEAGFAASQSDRGAGTLASLGWMRVSNAFTVSARVEAASRAFFRIGDVSRPDRLRTTASVSWSDPWDGGYALTMAQARGWDGLPSRSWTGVYSRPISARASLQMTALVVEEPRASVAASLSFATSFGARRSASAQIESNVYGVRAGARAQQTPDPTGGLGWRLAASGGQTARYDGGGYAITPIGEGEIELSKSGESTGARTGFRGGFALLDGAVYAARPLRDAFALAEAPAGMDVMLDNRRVARTGASGRVLIPDLRANEVNRLSLDVDQAPADARIGVSEIVARPGARGGARAQFDIQRQAARWIEIVDTKGAALPRGALLTRGDGAQFFTGDGGRAYVARTETARVLTAVIAGQSCAIDLAQTGERLICAPS